MTQLKGENHYREGTHLYPHDFTTPPSWFPFFFFMARFREKQKQQNNAWTFDLLRRKKKELKFQTIVCADVITQL